MRLLSTLFLAASLIVPSAFAQMPAPPACDGSLAIVRVSDIKPDSSMDKFMEAVAAQKSWYASKGLGDRIFVTKLVDHSTGAYMTNQAMTYHVYGATTHGEPAHDAGFDAFVKLFGASSIIKTTYFTCIPKGVLAGM